MPAEQGGCNRGGRSRTDPDETNPAENRKVGGSIPSLPTTNGAPLALRSTRGQRSTPTRSAAVTIRKRRGGWQVIVYAGLDTLTGKQRQLTRQVNGSYRQAEKVEAHLRTEVADGQHAGTRVKTLDELLDLWIERRAASDKPISPDTVEDYRSLIAKKIRPAVGSKRLHPPRAPSRARAPCGRRQACPQRGQAVSGARPTGTATRFGLGRFTSVTWCWAPEVNAEVNENPAYACSVRCQLTSTMAAPAPCCTPGPTTERRLTGSGAPVGG
jgi:hypothetical protein